MVIDIRQVKKSVLRCIVVQCLTHVCCRNCTFSSNTMILQNYDSVCEQASLSYINIYKIRKVFPGTACSLLTFTSCLPLLVNLICTMYYLCVSKHCPTKFSGHVVINLIFFQECRVDIQKSAASFLLKVKEKNKIPQVACNTCTLLQTNFKPKYLCKL